MGVTTYHARLVTKGLAGVLGLMLPALVLAVELNLEIVGPNGAALPHTAVALLAEEPFPEQAKSDAVHAVMDQRERQFRPYVLTVSRGTLVRFPNSDDIRHHVYSFSPAKRFELRLYHGTAAEPVLFDRAGTVTLGCNIHDAMLAYIYVVDSHWHGVSDSAGQVQLRDVPTGRYELKVQHPRLSQPKTRTLTVAGSGAMTKRIEIDNLGPDPRGDRQPSDLQRLFDQ